MDDVSTSGVAFLARLADANRIRQEELDARCVKRRFLSERLARNRMHDIHLESDEVRVPVRAVPCEKCFGWHLTSWPAPSK